MRAVASNSDAFNTYSEGLISYEKYGQERDIDFLDSALASFKDSEKKDPDFFLPRYLQAVIDDIKGNPKSAAEKLIQLYDKAPEEYSDLVKYSLALSLYHHYDTAKIDTSIKYFNEISSANKSVKLLARAGAIQSQSVKIMLYNRSKDVFEQAKADQKQILEEGSKILNEARSRKLRTSKFILSHRKDINWITNNAMGLASMYMSDSIRYKEAYSEEEKKQFEAELILAEKEFKKADKISKDNWAIKSNFGSLYQRLAKLYKCFGDSDKEKEFYQKTIDVFNEVLEIRPNYDFAFYELGKLERVLSKFQEAIVLLNQSIEAATTDEENVPLSSKEKQLKYCREEYSSFF